MRRWSTRVWVGHVGPKADSPNTCKNQTHVKTTRLTDIIDSLLLKQSETNMFPDVPCNHPQQWGLNKQHGPLPGRGTAPGGVAHVHAEWIFMAFQRGYVNQTQVPNVQMVFDGLCG